MSLALAQQVPIPPGVGHTMNDATALVMLFAVLGTAIIILWPLARAIARRLEGSGRVPQAELEGLRSRVDQLEQGQGRLAELEERLDFAERMLAQSREPDRIQR